MLPIGNWPCSIETGKELDWPAYPYRDIFILMAARIQAPPNLKPTVHPDREVSAIPSFVKERRTANGLTQRELAELAGVGPRAVWDLERGKPTVRTDMVNAVLRVFGKTLGVVDAPRDDGDRS
jgi:y4mF family transcriptional regulator